MDILPSFKGNNCSIGLLHADWIHTTAMTSLEGKISCERNIAGKSQRTFFFLMQKDNIYLYTLLFSVILSFYQTRLYL